MASASTWPLKLNMRPETALCHVPMVLHLEAPPVASAQGEAESWRCFTKQVHKTMLGHETRINHEMLLTKLLRGRPHRRRRLRQGRERSTCARVVPPPCPAAAACLLFFGASSVEESEESLPPPLVAIPVSAVVTVLCSPLPPSVQERGVFSTAGFSLI